MRYVTAILLPPLAVLRCRRRAQTAINVLLTLCFYLPGALHAALVVFDHQESERAKGVEASIRQWQVRTSIR